MVLSKVRKPTLVRVSPGNLKQITNITIWLTIGLYCRRTHKAAAFMFIAPIIRALTYPGSPVVIHRSTSGSPLPPRCEKHRGQTGRRQAEEAATERTRTNREGLKTADIMWKCINTCVMKWSIATHLCFCRLKFIKIASRCCFTWIRVPSRGQTVTWKRPEL